MQNNGLEQFTLVVSSERIFFRKVETKLEEPIFEENRFLLSNQKIALALASDVSMVPEIRNVAKQLV